MRRNHIDLRDACFAVVERHHTSLFHGLPRSIATRQAVVEREREQHKIEDALDGIERAIFRKRTAG